MKMINGTILNPFYILLSLDTRELTHIRILGLGSDVRMQIAAPAAVGGSNFAEQQNFGRSLRRHWNLRFQ
jgi:hypothetical protein